MAAKPINTLRLWAAAAPDYFDFQEFGTRRLRRRASRETLEAESLTRVLYPDDSTTMRARAALSCRNIFWSLVRWPTWSADSAAHNSDWEQLPEKVAIQLNDTHPTHVGRRTDAHPAGRCASGMGRGVGSDAETLAYTNHTLLPEALEKWPVAWFEDAAAPAA